MDSRSSDIIPLNVLVCHSNPRAVTQLVRVLEKSKHVSIIRVAGTLQEAQTRALSTELQLIFMDLFLLDDTQFVGNYLAYNIEHATDFIFTLRKLLPKTIFILYTSVASLEIYGSQIFAVPVHAYRTTTFWTMVAPGCQPLRKNLI